MNTFKGLIWKCGLSALLLSATLSAQTVTYKGMYKGSSMKIDGTSTVHDWTVESKLISGSLQLEGEFPADLSAESVPALPSAPKVEVKIAARSLKSGKSTMDQVMLAAMKSDDHPWIIYKLNELTPSKGKRNSGDALAYDAKGELSMSGVTQKIQMPVSISPTKKGLKIVGKIQVKMTDFGIQPPAPKIALGLIKTADEVDLSFEWQTQKK
ncbi:MAG: YceI family protein [Verrucomicrobiota bacterium]|jgi:polyisoprenoid-binding protein YceI|nr:YceI family protein [Verrucomicrobiota bacterium]